MVVGSQQLHDVGVVASGQDLDLHDVVLQLLLTLGLDDFGGSQVTRLLVLGLQNRDTGGQRGVLGGHLTPGSWLGGRGAWKQRPDVQPGTARLEQGTHCS